MAISIINFVDYILSWRKSFFVLILFVCFVHRLFTPASTPKGVDFCVHDRLYSRLKGSRAYPYSKFSIPLSLS